MERSFSTTVHTQQPKRVFPQLGDSGDTEGWVGWATDSGEIEGRMGTGAESGAQAGLMSIVHLLPDLWRHNGRSAGAEVRVLWKLAHGSPSEGVGLLVVTAQANLLVIQNKNWSQYHLLLIGHRPKSTERFVLLAQLRGFSLHTMFSSL